jgi:lysophospholipase L1-like esterase
MKRRALLATGAILAGGGRAMAADNVINLVFDGDSISAGAGSTPGHGLGQQVAAGLGGNARLHDVAAGGRPVSDCLLLFPKQVTPLYASDARFNVIVFHAGDNDIEQGRSAAQTYGAFTVYVSQAHQQGWKVVVSTELRRFTLQPQQRIELGTYNELLRANKAGADAVVDFDTDPRLTSVTNRANPAVFSPDGIHPSDGGYAILAAMLIPAIKKVAPV